MEKIDSVVGIKTDINEKVCSFGVDPSVDYQSKLTEFAKKNPHLADYEIQP